MHPGYPQPTGSAPMEVARPVAPNAESKAANRPPKPGNHSDLGGSQIPATAAAKDFAEATPAETTVAVNAAAVDSNQQVSLSEAATKDVLGGENTSARSWWQDPGSAQQGKADRDAVLFRQGLSFVGGEEAEISRPGLDRLDADLGAITTPKPKAVKRHESDTSSVLTPDTTPVASSKEQGRLRNDSLSPPIYDPKGKKGPASVVYDAGDQIFKQNEAHPPRKPGGDLKEADEEAAITSQPDFVEEPEELQEDSHDDARSVESDGDAATPPTLASRLFNALEETYDYKFKSTRFLPKKKLRVLITIESVTEELRLRLGPYIHVSRIRELARRVCEEKPVQICRHGKTRTVLKSFRQIFAILLLCDKAETIDKFLGMDGSGELSDLDLPLIAYTRRSTHSNGGGHSYKIKDVLQLRKRDENGKRTKERLHCFDGWETISLDFFHERQWLLLAPYFSRDRDGRVRHWKLMDRHILPFIPRSEDCQLNEIDGGYARVFMVNIHPDHQFFDDPSPSREFAIKQLRSYDMEKFEREVNILKKFSEHTRDPHIVSLLATYEHCEKLHMVFHRAEGNLHQYWTELNPKPEFTYENVLWMSRQITGVTKGLLRLHRHYTEKPVLANGDAKDKDSEPGRTLLVSPSFDSVTGDYLTIGQDVEVPATTPKVRIIESDSAEPSPPPQSAVSPVTGLLPSLSLALPGKEGEGKEGGILQYGRHTDITPNNILWYDNQPGEDGGVLKVADFGQSEIHSYQSKTHLMSNSKVEGWLPYRPPECDLSKFEPQWMNQAYDIWSLGCVFLEFVTWMLGGAELFHEFAKKRRSLDVRCAMDTIVFFELRLEDENSEVPTAQLKAEVEDFIDKLHAHQNCTEYFHRLLDIIENNMLKEKPRDRMGCVGIAKKLETLDAECRKDPAFAKSPNPWTELSARQRPARTPTIPINPKNIEHQALILRCAAVFQNFGQKTAASPVDTGKN